MDSITASQLNAIKYFLDNNPVVVLLIVIWILTLTAIGEWIRNAQANKRAEISEEKAYNIAPESKDGIKIERLFDLYSKQIEKYQIETRSRATWSFIFGILSMCAGMSFMFWGGRFILSADGANHVAAGAAISAIGGGISAYITKTFLDVHKLSLNQLNRYFTQPVINDHIVMAQRLAEDVKDDEVRKKSYEKIVSSITALIDATNADLHKSSVK